MMTDKFRNMILEDIKKCSEMSDIEMGSDIYYGEETIFSFYLYLISCYKRYINDIEDNLLEPVGSIDEEFDNCIKNLKIVERKLELFLEEETEKQQNVNTPVSVYTNISNQNSNNVSVKVSFEQVRKDIENMTTLPDSELRDILKKVEELEVIVQSQDRRTKKWENAKEIIKWVADKGVDVGIALLPLLLKI